jgi:hypothetical protein
MDSSLFDALTLHFAKSVTSQRKLTLVSSLSPLWTNDFEEWAYLLLNRLIQSLCASNSLKVSALCCLIEDAVPVPYVFPVQKEYMEFFCLNFLLLCLSEGQYDSRSRACLLRLPFMEEHILIEQECQISERIDALVDCSSDSTSGKSTETANATKRWMAIGGGAIAFGTLIGLSAGLAAPMILPAVAGLLGMGAAVSVTSSAVIGSLFGVTGAGTSSTLNIGLTGSKIHRRTGSVKEFKFLCLKESRRLCYAISVSGWMSSSTEENQNLWNLLAKEHLDLYELIFETKIMTRLGKTLNGFFKNAAINLAATQVAKMTFFGAILSAVIWPLGILKAASIIDNRIYILMAAWSLAYDRGKKAGVLLGHVLCDRIGGHRPV